MNAFEQHLNRMRQIGGEDDPCGADDYVIGLRAIAEGLSELIELLRPAVDVITAKPEGFYSPLEICGALPGDNARKDLACVAKKGHPGPHIRWDWSTWPAPGVAASEAYLKADNQVQTNPCGVLGPKVDRGSWGVNQHRCRLNTGHAGVHTDGTERDGKQVMW